MAYVHFRVEDIRQLLVDYAADVLGVDVDIEDVVVQTCPPGMGGSHPMWHFEGEGDEDPNQTQDQIDALALVRID